MDSHFRIYGMATGRPDVPVVGLYLCVCVWVVQRSHLEIQAML